MSSYAKCPETHNAIPALGAAHRSTEISQIRKGATGYLMLRCVPHGVAHHGAGLRANPTTNVKQTVTEKLSYVHCVR